MYFLDINIQTGELLHENLKFYYVQCTKWFAFQINCQVYFWAKKEEFYKKPVKCQQFCW